MKTTTSASPRAAQSGCYEPPVELILRLVYTRGIHKDDLVARFAVSIPRIRFLVVWALGAVIEIFCFRSWLSRVDFPTLGAPDDSYVSRFELFFFHNLYHIGPPSLPERVTRP